MNNKILGFLIALLILLGGGCLVFLKIGKQADEKIDLNPSGKTVVFNVTAQKFRFDPAEIRVNKGENVIINITGIDATHVFAITEYGINKMISHGKTEQVRFVADKAGTFAYTCTIPGHQDMKGSLIVSQEIQPPLPGEAKKTLSLKNQGLEKFPQEILGMTDLVELDISSNRLTGALPAEIRFLKNLKKLNASDNRMTGIPAEIGQLSELEELDYSDNMITGLPLELKNLKKLKILNLTGNDYSTIDLAQIKSSLPGLVVVGEK